MLTLVVTIVVGLAINEMSDLAPATAQRIVKLAARLWSEDAAQQEIYAEEWSAYIEERPGKLYKLGTALLLLCSATANHLRARAKRPTLNLALSRTRTTLLLRRVGSVGTGDSATWLSVGALAMAVFSTWIASLLLATEVAFVVMLFSYGIFAAVLVFILTSIVSFSLLEIRSSRKFDQDLADLKASAASRHPAVLPDLPPPSTQSEGLSPSLGGHGVSVRSKYDVACPSFPGAPTSSPSIVRPYVYGCRAVPRVGRTPEESVVRTPIFRPFVVDTDTD